MVLVKMTCIGHCKIVMQFSGGPKDAFESFEFQLRAISLGASFSKIIGFVKEKK